MTSLACSRLVAFLVTASLFCFGCSAQPKPNLAQIRAGWIGPDTRGLEFPSYNLNVHAVCDPPVGWKPDTLKVKPGHIHQAWLSPTGQTAYGVIYFKLPLPVGQNLALNGFLSNMKKDQGDVTLLDRQDDPALPGIRFVAEGGRYLIRANLIVSNWEGWTIYAGTLRGGKVIPAELDFAVRAREHTQVGQPDVGH
jgi:hypothetical protein